jgi:hypothetical protein
MTNNGLDDKLRARVRADGEMVMDGDGGYC